MRLVLPEAPAASPDARFCSNCKRWVNAAKFLRLPRYAHRTSKRTMHAACNRCSLRRYHTAAARRKRT